MAVLRSTEEFVSALYHHHLACDSAGFLLPRGERVVVRLAWAGVTSAAVTRGA